jgi:hypothetical protein
MTWTLTLGVLAGCAHTAPTAPADQIGAVDPAEARLLALEAFTFAYPMLEDYKTMYAQNIDRKSPAYRAPMNQPAFSTRLAGPDNTDVVRYNNDNLYTATRLDLRAEPMVWTVPDMGDRYFVIQVVDMYTHNIGYIGTRATGGKAGNYVIAGPSWDGVEPEGTSGVIRAETNFVYVIQRTALTPDEVQQVAALIKTFQLRPLHSFAGEPAPQPPPVLAFPAYDKKAAESAGFIGLFNFLLAQLQIHPTEKPLFDRWAAIGIGPGKPFDAAALPPQVRQAIDAGVKQALERIVDRTRNMGAVKDGWQVITNAFGDRQRMQGQYLTRAAAAMVGLYGNDIEEAYYPATQVDAAGQPLDGAKHRYVITFVKEDLPPPVRAFWSLTMYQLPGQTMVKNPLNRYSIGDRSRGLEYGKDGSLTIYIQHQSPGKDLEANWLPAPNGPFVLQFRAYLPNPEAIEGPWAPPPVRPGGSDTPN